MKRIILLLSLITITLLATAQQKLQNGTWRGCLLREDGNVIAFNFELTQQQGKTTWVIRNAEEKITVKDIRIVKDSIWITMPAFESQFKLKVVSPDSIQGVWIRQTSSQTVTMPFEAKKAAYRYLSRSEKADYNISGRWSAIFYDEHSNDTTIAEFTQKGQYLTGTFLTTGGDYRYLEGVVGGDRIQLSGFDGLHAFYFSASVSDSSHIRDGLFCSGKTFQQTWSAERNKNAALPETGYMPRLKPGEDRLNFSFTDLNGKTVSINDKRFKNKVTVVQIMGSWCPNCMDETNFLSDFYNKNKQRGIEVVALAYEYSTDEERSKKSLAKFQKLYNVQYPMLLTDVKVSDPKRTEKTLPQITPVKVFPTPIFIGKEGKVKKFDTGFNGPATGEHYEAYKAAFEKTIRELL